MMLRPFSQQTAPVSIRAIEAVLHACAVSLVTLMLQRHCLKSLLFPKNMTSYLDSNMRIRARLVVETKEMVNGVLKIKQRQIT